MEKTNNNSNQNQSIIKTILNRDFVISAIVPIIIFAVFNNYNMTLDGVILSGLWCIGVLIFSYVKEHQINALAIIAGAFSGIGIIGAVLSKDPTFYLIAPIVQDFLIAAAFLGSLFFKRSLLQVIVEQSYLRNLPEEFKMTAKYKKTWIILSIAWGVLNISQAAARIVLLHSVSMSSYYTINTLYSNISTPALIAISIAFPRWYWKTGKSI